MNKFKRLLLAFAQLGIFFPCIWLMSGEKSEKPEASEKEGAQLDFPATLLDLNGNKISSDVLEGKYVGLYFSASWCGPCRAFTPSLIKFRNQNKSEFEVVLVGADGSSRAQANYMKKYKMPWLAMQNHSAEVKEVKQVTGVKQIPALVILSPSGNILSKDGKKELVQSAETALESWKSRAKK
jgi:thiol-disulfide isomerase/thioredoxin